MYKNASRFLQRRAYLGEPRRNSAFAPEKFRPVPKRLRRAFKSGELVKGRLAKNIKGGYTIKFGLFHAFCPSSQMYPAIPSNADIDFLQNHGVDYAVIKADSSSAVVSRRRAVQKITIAKIAQAYRGGETLEGTIKVIKPYGAFVDLGCVDGLVHISEVSDSWIDDLSKVLKNGQKVKVIVIDIDEKKTRISLSMRIGIHMK
jgi:small subunit ribosomal protein S1